MLRMLKDIKPGNPTIGIRFCIDPVDRANLIEHRVVEPYVLLVVAYQNGYDEDRQLVPLSQIMTYVGFRFPGKHRVFARLVWSSSNSLTLRKKILEQNSRGKYEYQVLDALRDAFRDKIVSVDQKALSIDCDEFEIDVPRGYFAKEPPNWLKWYANWGYKYLPVDECEFRKRAYVAGLPKLVPFLTVFLFTVWLRFVSYAVSLVLGARGLKFGPILHPWTGDMEDVWPEIHLLNGKGHCSH